MTTCKLKTMNQQLLIDHSSKLIDLHFDLERSEQSLSKQQFLKIEELKNALKCVIAEMLDNEFNRLLNIMYRIDINEKEFQQATSSTFPAENLTDLVLKRELQKVQTRIKYSM